MEIFRTEYYKKATRTHAIYMTGIFRAIQISFSANFLNEKIRYPFLSLADYKDKKFWNDFINDPVPEERIKEIYAQALMEAKNKLKIADSQNQRVQEYAKAYTLSYIEGKNSVKKEHKHVAKLNSKVSVKSLLFNQSIIGFISAFEVYIKEMFITIINEKKEIKDKVLCSAKKISFLDLKRIEEDKESLGDIIARGYNFQNLEEIYSAYKFIEIDIKRWLLREDFLSTLKDCIKRRHKIIHENHLYLDLDFEKVYEIFKKFHSFDTTSLRF